MEIEKIFDSFHAWERIQLEPELYLESFTLKQLDDILENMVDNQKTSWKLSKWTYSQHNIEKVYKEKKREFREKLYTWKKM